MSTKEVETFVGPCSEFVSRQGWTTKIPVEQIEAKGYRKESDTAKDVITLIKNGVELNSMIDGDAKIAIINELRWAGQKYSVKVE